MENKPPAARMDLQEESSHIGPSMRMKGDIAAGGSLAIAGQFEGNIDIPKRELTVADGAKITANIRASSVRISGKLNGEVQGIERVELTGTADMTGKLQTREIRVEEGAVFRGQVDIITDRE